MGNHDCIQSNGCPYYRNINLPVIVTDSRLDSEDLRTSWQSRLLSAFTITFSSSPWSMASWGDSISKSKNKSLSVSSSVFSWDFSFVDCSSWAWGQVLESLSSCALTKSVSEWYLWAWTFWSKHLEGGKVVPNKVWSWGSRSKARIREMSRGLKVKISWNQYILSFIRRKCVIFLHCSTKIPFHEKSRNS